MNEYRHHVSGFFAECDEARKTMATLVAHGVPPAQIRIYETDEATSGPAPKEDSNAVLKDVLVDGAIGTAVGTGLGALAQVALVATSVTLFVASPLVAPLAMLGWGAAVGGVIGASVGATADPVGADKKDGWLEEMVRDAIASGQIVLVAETRTEQETALARDVIGASVGDVKEIAAA